MINKKVLYRYEVRGTGSCYIDINGELMPSNLPPEYTLECLEIEIIRETERCYVVKCYENKNFEKFVLKNPSKKCFAYDNKKSALKNYILRTKKYVSILKEKLDKSMWGIAEAEKSIKIN